MADDDLTFMPWYFDQANEPSCPSFWEDFECDRNNCPFSHEVPKYQSDIPIKGDSSENPVELFTYIKNYIIAFPNLENIHEVKLSQPAEEEKDFERINQLMNEMLNFEKGPEIFDSHVICPFLSECGNCIIKESCEFAHSKDDQKIKDIEREQEWYPSSMNCECCKGYLYGCIAEECKKQGKCIVCIS
ncbi:hypothetical protein SteCoe_24119 [Stentor coeruleus]|uniref:C3H1-type domain-containing protein n=1 Tax=Stentor coeruleus TaxID=5963 RepID=A0A1R2BI81_9CILI|nr:hypothetical protein SteCoe_24119 [Stentor coeruleus]